MVSVLCCSHIKTNTSTISIHLFFCFLTHMIFESPITTDVFWDFFHFIFAFGASTLHSSNGNHTNLWYYLNIGKFEYGKILRPAFFLFCIKLWHYLSNLCYSADSHIISFFIIIPRYSLFVLFFGMNFHFLS